VLAAVCGLVLAGAAAAQAQRGASTTTGTTPTTPAVAPLPSGPRPAMASLDVCQVAVAQADRVATFSGEMGAISGAKSMEIKVNVLESAPGSGFTTPPGGAGTWQHSNASKVYRLVRNLTNLDAPASYKANVSFRWLSAQGKVVARASKHTPTCVLPNEDPLLSISSIAARLVDRGQQADYHVLVRNSGRGPATSFPVVLVVNGASQAPLTVPSLAAHTTIALDEVAPVCTAGSSVTAEPDPQHTITEAAGGGQPLSISCPLPSSS
jgi:hypothetical protein